ncbi:MAG TPA: FHA domain-containing protein, partial [Polyangiaceae bacterium]
MPFTLDETERTHGPIAFVRVPRVTLVVIDGASRGSTIQAGASPVRVGSSEACALRLDDRRVSRVHFEIAVTSDRVAVRDLGSTNGTFVDGVRVRDADVAASSVVRAGDSAIRVDVDQSPAQIALSPCASFGELVGSSVEMRMVY